jgi:hypothetical protein
MLACKVGTKKEKAMDHLKQKPKQHHLLRHLIETLLVLVIATCCGTVSQAAGQVTNGTAIQVGN